MSARHRSLAIAATLLVAAFVVEGTGAAQTVMEVQGGGSSLVGGYGVTTNFWRNGMDGWIGLGYLDGLPPCTSTDQQRTPSSVDAGDHLGGCR